MQLWSLYAHYYDIASTGCNALIQCPFPMNEVPGKGVPIFLCYWCCNYISINMCLCFKVDVSSNCVRWSFCRDLFHRLQDQIGLTHLVVRPVSLPSEQSGLIFQSTITQMYDLSFLHWDYIHIPSGQDKTLESYQKFNSKFLIWQYNFVGRLLGPRGNSLKRVEASTDCRVLIRGRGSIKDPIKVFII